MIFRQITHDDLGCASYLIGDEDAGVAAVVDPRLDVDEYLELARYMDVRIEHVLETHTHADHVSGHGRLAAATGAPIRIHRAAEVAYPHEPFEDGDAWELGSLVVRVLHTPGHRPEHTAFLLVDTRRGDRPWAVLTGDTLFVGDIARPDLAIEEAEGARGIFRSLRSALLSLPDEVELWPGHLGGSMCGGPGIDMKIASTIGFERRHNAALGIADEDRFVERALAGLGPQPPNFRAIVELNRGPFVSTMPEPRALSPREVAETGALVVDVRTDGQFDEAHIPGALSIPMLTAGFGTKLAWLAGRERELVFAGRDDADGRRAAALAAAVGLGLASSGSPAGFLAGGMTSWRQESLPVARLERVALDDQFARRDGVQLLDVRERSEWEEGHIDGSVFVPWHDIDGVPEGLDPARPIAVMCATGQRAAVAASLLQRHGAERVIHVVGGGVPRWLRLAAG
jgi:hydroxyacylglutathione hydrolase